MPSIAEQLTEAIGLHQAGDLSGAGAAYRAVLRQDPSNADALHLLGVAAHQEDRDRDAAELIASAIRANQEQPAYYSNLGVVLRRLGRLDEAVANYRRAVGLKPDYAEAFENLGNALMEQGDLAAASEAYGKAVAIQPSRAKAHNGLGVIELELGAFEAAAARFRDSLNYASDFALAHHNLGVALLGVGRTEEAIQCFERAVDLDPDYDASVAELIWARQLECDWRDREAEIARLLAMIDASLEAGRPSPIDPFSLLNLPSTPAQHRKLAEAYSARVEAKAAPARDKLAFAYPSAATRLRIGYLSADFHAHATTYLMQGLFAAHDRDRFEILVYSTGPDDGSEFRQRVAGECDRFVDLSTAFDTDAARRINADGVHILLDLKGWTSRCRPGIAALRPAPVQAAYLGYPGTTGAPFIDYVLTDRVVTPPEAAGDYSERFVYLPHTYQVTDNRRLAAQRSPSRAECGLPEDGVVFCCFNHAYKIEPRIFDAWMRILAGTPGSVLWLLRASPSVERNLKREAGARGVAAERIVFAERVEQAEHLARHRLADLFLDTHFYNAHTTASDALWMGLPVLTWPGRAFASRVAASLVTAIGLPELIAPDLDAYEAAALRLAGDPDEMATLRARLEANRRTEPLFDTPRFVRNLERAFGLMWEDRLAGGPPREIVVDETDSPGHRQEDS